jgi:long-chain fatty acid transport protein
MAGFLTLPMTVHAGAFQLPTDNAAGWSRANAGGSLFANDPTAFYNNPAAMAFFDGPEIQATATLIRPQASFIGHADYSNGAPVSGSAPDGFGRPKAFPNLAYVNPINDHLAVGFGLTVPFGLASNYNTGWQGRYFGTRTSLQSIAGSMSIAYKVNDKFSVGLGVTGQRTKAQLNTMLDPSGSAYAMGIPLQPGEDELQLNVKVRKQLAMGYFGGIVFKPTDRDVFGASYHSGINQRLSGTYAIYGGATGKALLAAASLIDPALPTINPVGAPATVAVNLPAFASVDWLHTFTDRFSLAGSVQWTNWSCFQNLELISNGQKLIAITESYKDSYIYSIGGDYMLTAHMVLRAGIGYDETPTTITGRDPRVPDGSRKLLGFGFGYKFSKNVTIDFGYQHQFVNKTMIRQKNALALGAGTLTGYYEDEGDVINLSGTYHF